MCNKLVFKYLVKGDHSIFMKVNRRCLTITEATRIKEALQSIGYKITVVTLNDEKVI